jgi:hypothetical protein
MAIKERYQNPVPDDTVLLRLFVYNQNAFSNFQSIENVQIYKIPDNESIEDISKGTLVRTVDSADIKQDETGKYYIELDAEYPLFTVGKYVDIWNITFKANEGVSQVINTFNLYPELWYTTPIPVVYDFSFAFRPNRFRKGSKQYIICQITPNVPRGTDLGRYYENLIINSNVKISMEISCGDCVPVEQDLRLVLDNVPTDYREKNYAYYMLDTAELDVGIYNVWFTMEMGENVFISDRMNLQIFT